MIDCLGNICNQESKKQTKSIKLLQHTGIKDINKKDIYEGDIARYINQYPSGVIHTEKIVFKDGQSLPLTQKDEFSNNEWINFI